MAGRMRHNRMTGGDDVQMASTTAPRSAKRIRRFGQKPAKRRGYLPLSFLILAESRDLVRAAALG